MAKRDKKTTWDHIRERNIWAIIGLLIFIFQFSVLVYYWITDNHYPGLLSLLTLIAVLFFWLADYSSQRKEVKAGKLEARKILKSMKEMGNGKK